MKKLVIFLAIVSLFSSLLAVTISEKIGIVILPAKVGNGWNMDEADFLISILEQKALELGRFRVFSRNDLDMIVKERNLGDLGLVEQTFEAGKILGARYAILLTLTELTSNYEKNGYTASLRLSLKLYDLKNGELLASTPFAKETYVEEETPQKAINSVLMSAADDIWLSLREYFKLEAYVSKIEGNKIYLAGLDPKIAKKGFIFKLETSTGEVGYAEVIGIDRNNNLVITKFKYGAMPSVYDPAIEYPVSSMFGGISVGLYSGKIALGIAGWQNNLYFESGIILSSFAGYIPGYVTLGGSFDLIEVGQLTEAIYGGLQILAIYDTETTSESSFLPIFGINIGTRIKYEFEPKSGIFVSVGASALFPDSVSQSIYDILFGMDTTSFLQIGAGYFMSF
ncbi:hypothetical protein HNP65_001030 [Thermosipho japonicus]|uniref:Curli production assembly/transport component CsgG n=1 Tax=Thermosipho japonicus TaxID=90323 RepID=A0A841GG87_9BACT|nr:CsgG/HfaB family protein [Thermosipho japonicus]MBB6062592.1 hypothetical protein [Thermosipho japonicus]